MLFNNQKEYYMMLMEKGGILKKYLQATKNINSYLDGPFERGEDYLCLGEIKNMKDHFIFVDKAGKVLYGYHNDDFRILTEDEC